MIFFTLLSCSDIFFYFTDRQWEKLMKEKETAVNGLEQEYRAKYEKLKEQFQYLQKNNNNKEGDLAKKLDVLQKELHEKESTIGSLKNNVDTLNGGIQVLNSEIANQDQTIKKVKEEADQKIRYPMFFNLLLHILSLCTKLKIHRHDCMINCMNHFGS